MAIQITRCKIIIVTILTFLVAGCVALIFIFTFNLDEDLQFRLYTREHPVDYVSLRASSIARTSFDPKRPTRIFVHGYLTKEKVMLSYREAYLALGDFNFIAVDWMEGARHFNYYAAKGRIVPVSQRLAQIIDALVDYGMKLNDLTIVGHSLGSHIAGLAAKKIMSNGKIGRIVGLDPASVGFKFNATDKRLTETDAEYVQIIHTDTDKFGLGISRPIGHADFYPNGGHKQPGCVRKVTSMIDKVKCSHVRAHNFFLESLKWKFEAIQCVSYDEIKAGECTFNNVTAFMGGDSYDSIEKPYGIFYLETKSESPFNINHFTEFKNIKLKNNSHFDEEVV